MYQDSKKRNSKLATMVELAGLCSLLAAVIYLTTFAGVGMVGLSWDTLNHHIYLGMTAERPRWHLDAFAAGSQTYQYPYLYWPIYRLSLLDLPANVFWQIWSAVVALLVVPPMWLIVRALIPSCAPWWKSASVRLTALSMSVISLPVIFSIQTTSNDIFASSPVLWALALFCSRDSSVWPQRGGAFLLGVATAFKLSNIVFWPLLLTMSGHLFPLKQAAARLASVFAVAIVGYGIAYAPWGLQLFRETGNPFYPFLMAHISRQ